MKPSSWKSFFLLTHAKRVVVLVTLWLWGTALFGASPKVMRLAHLYQPDSPSGMGLRAFGEMVENYSDGRIKVKVFPGGQLGSARNIYISSKTGAIDFCAPALPILSDTVPEFTIMNAGYLFEDFEHMKRVLEAPHLGRKWNEEVLKKCHLRLLGAYYYGKRVVTTRDTIFHTPNEARGVKIRAVPNPMSLAVIRGIGGNPTPMAMKEVFIGLSQGVIDGQENPYPTIWANKWYEVQKYAVETFHQYNAVPFAISERSWQELNPEDRQIIERAAGETMDLITSLTNQFEAEIVEKLKAEGMVIVPHQELALAEFQQSVREIVRTRFDGKVWPAGLMDEVLAVRGETAQ